MTNIYSVMETAANAAFAEAIAETRRDTNRERRKKIFRGKTICRGGTYRKTDAPGANEQCSCGSGKKYKYCCG